MEVRALIVNGDDFGQSLGINQGIAQAFEKGILTSASLMVRWLAAESAATYAKAHPNLSVGLHVDLGEWELRNSQWVPKYQVVDLSDADAVWKEVEQQFRRFKILIGRHPTHLDSHQHVHRKEPVKSVVMRLAEQLGVPLRHFDERIQYVGRFYGQTEEGETRLEQVSPDALERILRELPGPLFELACHPAAEVDFDSMYANERVYELEALCANGLMEGLSLANVKLGPFHSIREELVRQ